MALTFGPDFGTGGEFAPNQTSSDAHSMAIALSFLRRVHSYNTAFGNDSYRPHGQGAVGLGGNISNSIYSCKPGVAPTDTFESPGEDAGNGSLMRLAPIPIFFSTSYEEAVEYAQLSSLTTHPGPIAKEACGFLSFLIQSAIASKEVLDPKTFLDERAAAYEKILHQRGSSEHGIKELLLMLGSVLPDDCTERRFGVRGWACVRA